MTISAKIICDSISPTGARLTTMEIRFHRFILAELNTHRVFSRNSSSSRAIPSSKVRERVSEDMAWPVAWGSNQKGMQAGESLDPLAEDICRELWEEVAHTALGNNSLLEDAGLHKQVANRLLEPFMWHTAIVTATEWDNFFHQRCHPDAQPEMKALADAMQLAYFTGSPVPLEYDEWHLPYWANGDYVAALESVKIKATDSAEDPDAVAEEGQKQLLEIAKKVSVARCARVSYLTQDGVRDIKKDLELFERLVGGGHWSPFEHIATPLKLGYTFADDPKARWSGNFNGWKQYRKEFLNENRTKFMPNLPELSHITEAAEKFNKIAEEKTNE